MFKKSKVCTGVLLALSASVAVPVYAQSSERIEITGSRIKRIDAEGPLPVQVVTREDIARSGATSVNEIINNLTAVGQGSFGDTQQAGNSFAPGTAAVSLRGLGSNATLVLINGRRMSSYGFAQNLDEAFVDLNSISPAAIERIDILKDGASAIYGSDALAGVINIILRKDFRGFEITGGISKTQKGGADETQASISAGFGDFAKDRFNVFGVLSVYDREKLGAGDRDFSKYADQSAAGGFDFRSPTGNPGTWLTGGRGTDPATGAPYVDNTVFPSCPASSRGTFSDGRTTCYYNFAPDNWLIPKSNRVALFAKGTVALGSSLTAGIEVGLNKNVTNGSAAPTPGGATLPVGHVSNPFPFVVPIRYRYVEVGPRLNEIETDAQRALFTLAGENFGWSWEAGYAQSESKSTNTGTNYISQAALTAAIPSYNFADISAVPGSVIDGLRISPVRTGESSLKAFDVKASTELFSLPGGRAGLALGFDHREEDLADTPDSNTLRGNVVGSGGTSSKGDRSSQAVFAELVLPLTKSIEAQLAVRQDKYSDFGTATVPKVAMSWRPMTQLLLRASYGEGFRAPSLVQLFLGDSTSFPSIRDAVRCDIYTASTIATAAERTAACGAAQVRSVSRGNRELDAEKSKSFNVGIVFEPIRDLSIGLDYYNIEHTNKIDSLPSAYILRNAAELSAAAGFSVVNRNPASARDAAIGAPGSLLGIGADTGIGFYNTYFNAQRQETAGYDLDVRYRFSVGDGGRIGLRSVITYVDTFKREVTPSGGLQELNDTWQYPKLRANSSLTFDTGPWAVTLGANYIGSYDQFYQVTASRTKEVVSFDAQVQYRGIKNLTLTAGGRNITDRDPPWADVDYYGYDASNVDPRGAVWYLRAAYRF